MKNEQDNLFEKLAEQMTRQMLNPGGDPVLDAIIDDAIRDSRKEKEVEEEEPTEEITMKDTGATLNFGNVVQFRPREEKVTAATPLPVDDKVEIEVDGMKLRGTPEQIIATMKMMESLGQKG